MPCVERLLHHGTRRGRKALQVIGEEYRDKRIAVGLSQADVARAIGVSRSTYTRIEGGRNGTLSILRACQAASVLGLDLSVRAYPGANPLRDAASLARLGRFLAFVAPPLAYRTEVALPQRPGRPTELRAWDALITGLGRRTGVEMEMRLRDAQALERRLDVKRRDDPVDSLVLVIADTRGNRIVLHENPVLFPGLDRVGFTHVTATLAAGQHPPSCLVLI